MKKIIWFILSMISLIALLPCASAAVDTLESRYFFTDETFEAYNKIGIVRVNDDNNVIINYDNRLMVLDNLTCRTEYYYTSFCVEDLAFDSDRRKYKAKVAIYYFGPDITVTQSANVTNPYLGEGAKITVNLENNGNFTAENVTYIALLPPDIQFNKIKGDAVAQKVAFWGNDTGWQNMTRIYWNGRIRIGDTETFYYSIKPLKAMDTRLTAKAIYSNGVEDLTVYATDIALKTKNQFEVKSIFVKKDYDVSPGAQVTGGEAIAEAGLGNEFLYVTEIKNKAVLNHSLNVTYLDFYFPDGLQYLYSPMIVVHDNTSDENQSYLAGGIPLKKIDSNTYRWKGIIEGEGSIILVFRMRAQKEGIKRTTTTGNFVEFDPDKKKQLFSTSYSIYKDIDMTFNEIAIDSNFDDGASFDSGQQAYFTLWFQNPNEDTNITNIKAKMDVPWAPEKEKNISFVQKAGYIDLIDGFVYMPDVNSTQTRKFRANVTYQTPYGDTYSKDLQRSVTIRPHSLVSIKYDVQDASPVGTDTYEIEAKETYVTLTLSNTADRYIEGIDFAEQADPKLVKPGEQNTSEKMNMQAKAVTQIRKFRIDPPNIRTPAEYRIKAHIDYSLDGVSYSASKEITIRVKPKSLRLDITKSVFDENIIMGRPISIDYTLKNPEKETLYNITLIFPLTYGVDTIGSRTYSIDKLSPDESRTINGKEVIRPKMNGTVRLEKTRAVFHDGSGYEMDYNSSSFDIEPIYSTIESPAIFIEKNISNYTVNVSQVFNVSLLIRNIGPNEAYMKVQDAGRSWNLGVGAGKKNLITYTASINDPELSGMTVDLPLATATYNFSSETYTLGSNKVSVQMLGAKVEKKAKKPAAAETAPSEEAGGNATELSQQEKPKIDIMRYIYIMIFVIVVVVIIYFVSGIKTKEKGMEFLEEKK